MTPNPKPAPGGVVRTPIIHDGDHGSDDFLATLMALGRGDAFDLSGITTCHGNVSIDKVTRNACAAVDIAAPGSISVAKGSATPWKIPLRSGDDAFGNNGLGGVELPPPVTKASSNNAQEWLVDSLLRIETPLTLCVTGPMTNIARLLAESPQSRRKIDKIVAMGGCLGPLGPQRRSGNITPFAEFNFFMDPDAADYVLRSGVPVVLLPMDVTHQLVFTEARRKNAASKWSSPLGDKLITMLSAAEHLDRPKFGLDGAVIHDPQVIIYLLAPELYTGRSIGVAVNTDERNEQHGRMSLDESSALPILLLDTLIDPDAAFDLMIEAIQRILEPSS